MSSLSTPLPFGIALGVGGALLVGLAVGFALAWGILSRRQDGRRNAQGPFSHSPSFQRPPARSPLSLLRRQPAAAQARDAEEALLPAEIMAQLAAVPLLEQAKAAKRYVGMPVRWRVTFESAFPSGLTTLRLMCQDRGNFPWVLGDVRKGRFPALRGLVQHAPLWISGRVKRIEGDEIFLRNVHLDFGDKNDQQR